MSDCSPHLPVNSLRDWQRRLAIAGADEVARQVPQGLTHMISIANPGSPCPKPAGFVGGQLQLWFGDVISEADAQQCRTKAPTIQDVQKAVEFFRNARQLPETKILVCCDYGASRSPALAYVCVADHLGKGQETEALAMVLEIRPNAVPNKLVVQLGDSFLGRNGALLRPLMQFYSKLNEEISQFRNQ